MSTKKEKAQDNFYRALAKVEKAKAVLSAEVVIMERCLKEMIELVNEYSELIERLQGVEQ